MNDGYQLTGTNTCISEGWGILLNHGEQFPAIALYHTAHAVA